MATERLSAAQARRTALAAQGFTDRSPSGTPPTMAHLKRVVGRTGLLQMDSVNIVARAHFMPIYSRLGPYDPPDLLHRAAWQPVRGPTPSGRVLGARGRAHPGRGLAAVPLAHGRIRRWPLSAHPRDHASQPESRRRRTGV